MIRIKQYDISLKEQRNNKASVKTTTEVKQNKKSTDDKSSKLKEMVEKIRKLSKSNPEEAKKLLKTLKLANKDNVISEKTVKELEDLFIKDEEATKSDKTTDIDDKRYKMNKMVDKIKSLSKSNPEEAKKLLKTLKLANKDNVISEKTVKELEDLFIKDEETKNDGTAIRSCENFSSVETRGLVDDTRMVLYGYVNQVGKLSQPMRNKKGRIFREKILAGAFKRAIDRAKENNNPIKLLFRHNNKDLLASTINSSLNLEEDSVGLRFEANIVNTTLGRDVYNYVKTGLISNMSFGFRNAIDEWTTENGQNVRIVKDFDLTEISILDNPAYKDSIVKA
ncbi:HK97 family phage prohead protease [Clostridium thermobutyricum]|uniref:HK97 family phage prohead protease n=1 Tax=Clostridium thermobutyricum TaxID=29372 RepID=UPI0018A97509|nr:HK97 family phage prohead protease [Clostridium thermobutyricum]